VKKIIVVMEGGCVQTIIGIPEGVEVAVRDYDVEGIDLDRYLRTNTLFKDVDGQLCTEVRLGPSEDQDEAGLVPATKEDCE